jgi:hypothetical protein
VQSTELGYTTFVGFARRTSMDAAPGARNAMCDANRSPVEQMKFTYRRVPVLPEAEDTGCATIRTNHHDWNPSAARRLAGDIGTVDFDRNDDR